MVLDTTFLIDLSVEVNRGIVGRARAWLATNRNRRVWTTVISVGEIAVGFREEKLAREFLSSFRIARLHPEIAYEAAAIDRELLRTGGRLGENDQWIAGFARYYGEPVLSNDDAFDRVRGLRRHSY